ncbi:hypothetical protein JL720_15650 [Aureococcus anophagefferens]|nr:hypothetical protein JL720_15650 [Aureococcus anophagefferens]
MASFDGSPDASSSSAAAAPAWQAKLLAKYRARGAEERAAIKARDREATDAEFERLMADKAAADRSAHASFAKIPRFFAGGRRLQQKLRAWPRPRATPSSSARSSAGTSSRLRAALGAAQSEPMDGSGRINYEQLCEIRRDLEAASGSDIFHGPLSAEDFIPEMRWPRRWTTSSAFYVFTAVRRFMFFLDPKRRSRIPIATLAASTSFELHEMADVAAGSDRAARSSWFLPDNAKRVYSDYLELDEDHNGMLSKAELLNFRGLRGEARLTKAFVERALAYFWRLLDVKKQGSIDVFTINYFFREIADSIRDEGYDAPITADVPEDDDPRRLGPYYWSTGKVGATTPVASS